MLTLTLETKYVNKVRYKCTPREFLNWFLNTSFAKKNVVQVHCAKRVNIVKLFLVYNIRGYGRKVNDLRVSNNNPSHTGQEVVQKEAITEVAVAEVGGVGVGVLRYQQA